MKTQTARRLAWSTWGVMLATLVVGAVLSFAGDFSGEDVAFGLVLVPFVITFATVGALIAGRHPGNAIGWIFIGVALLWVVAGVGAGIADYADEQGFAVSALIRTADWLGAWVFIPVIYVPVTFLFLLFPDGRLPSRRWRPVAWISAIAVTGLTLGSAFAPAHSRMP